LSRSELFIRDINRLEQNHLVEKLSLQAESFQEGFKILTQSDSFEEIVRNFGHLLRANFIITNLHLFHKPSEDSEWKIYGSKKYDQSDINFLKDHKQLITYYSDQKYNASVVLPLSDSSYLGILLGNKLDGSQLTDFDKITLQILLQVFSSAHESLLNQLKEKKFIFDLNEKVLQLNNLIDTGIEISRFENQGILFDMALGRMVALTNASSALISISGADKDVPETQITFPGNIPPESITGSSYKIESSFEFHKKIYRFVLSEKETRKGVINFNELDQMLLDAISRQVKTAIENNFLLKESLEKDRIEKELQLAATIQKRIIPDKLPAIQDYELAGENIPSREVGGDYYDCVDLGGGKYALIIADVAGKGIAAALLVNTLNAALYSYLEFNLPLTEMADRLNKLIYNSSPPDKFITFFIAVLDSKTGELDVVNAGHNPILLLRKDGKLDKIDAGGIGLGMLDLGIPYQGEKLMMQPGDKLFLYTDGIPEAMNKDEEEYSDERMINFFQSNSDEAAADFINGIVADVGTHVKGEPQSDDITSMILKRIA
jgi:sigma-B regulation protein RsbU (phosphoserine phosphatase)